MLRSLLREQRTALIQSSTFESFSAMFHIAAVERWANYYFFGHLMLWTCTLF
jgi:hypothetical protein